MSDEAAPTTPEQGEPHKPSGRIFLVVIDNSPELVIAMRYACRRARRTGGRVALLHVVDTEDFTQFLGVSEVMREESRKEAEALVQKMASQVQEESGAMPVLYLREGNRRDELLKLIAEEPTISILVLGASTNPKGPGPLITALTGKFISRLRIPITIVPGNLSDADIESLA
ncbi:MAG TPA: universal stress protein [Candidatus Polarisedimenticolia bacterium]|jgi:nucleotide-binding universal stress UspA family protein|nr:universal stress protein [Candidatus Polarisedimenticolia bacterium]